MPPKPIELPVSHDELKQMYCDRKLSSTQIKFELEQKFNCFIPQTRVSLWISRLGISRDLHEASSLARRKLDYDVSYIDEALIEWNDGFILGDGSISAPSKSNPPAARYSTHVKQKEFGDYLMSGFKNYGGGNFFTPESDGITNNNTDTEGYYTYFHPDTYKMHQRWYAEKNGKRDKQPPEDVRVTHTSIMLWYLGDGCIIKHGSGTNEVRFATCSFEKERIEDILIPKMKSLGLCALQCNSENRIIIRRDGVRPFFEFMGLKSPVDCMQYKFDVDSWFLCHSMHEAAELLQWSPELDTPNKRYYRLSYLVKTGAIADVTRSPGGKKVMFSKSQIEAARQVAMRPDGRTVR
jgi:hypothetical protein